MDSDKKLPLKKRKYLYTTPSSSYDLTKTFVSPPLKKIKKSSTKTQLEADVLKSSNAVKIRKSSCWFKSRFLGRGSYGSVYLATRDKDNKMVAIKSAEITRASSLIFEKRILTRFSSPFVVSCYGYEITRESVFNFGEKTIYNLILEYCSGQSLADLIKDNRGALCEFDVKIFVRDILSGLTYIHDNNIIHCDIKPDNIFLCPKNNLFRPNGYLTKLGDFGLAMEKGSIEYGNGYGHWGGTRRYMAPELITDGFVDYGVDTWALGCTVLEMLTGVNVWEEHRDLDSDGWVNLIGYSNVVPHIPSWLSEEAQDFMSKCLERDVDKRWSSHLLQNHPFAK